MYIGTPTIECLAAFISGWFWSQGDRASDQEIWEYFLEYVEKGYHSQPHSWSRLIELKSQNSVAAYQKFFDLFDQSVAEFRRSK